MYNYICSLFFTHQEVEFGCGRKMSDVSSMFIVYLLEILQWHPGPTSNQVRLWSMMYALIMCVHKS